METVRVKLVADVSDLKKGLNNIQKDVSQLHGATKQYSTTAKEEFKRAASGADDFAEGLDKIEDKTNVLEGGFKRMAGMIGSMIIAGGAMQSVIKATDLYSDFEKTLTNVFTLLSRDDFERFSASLEAGSRRIMKEYGFSVEDVNKALFDTISAGIPAGEAIAFLDEAAKLAIAGVTDLATSVNGMTTIMNAYGVEIGDVEKISSAFFTAQKYGKTTVAELSGNIGQLVGIARQAGVSFETVLGGMAQLTLVGLGTAEATTALRASITALSNPTEGARKLFSRYNIEVGTSAIRSKGLVEMLRQLAVVAQEAPDELGKLIPNVEAIKAIGNLGTKELEALDKMIVQIREDIGENSSYQAAYNMQMKTYAVQISKVRAEMKDLGITVGGEVAGSMLKVIRWTRDHSETLDKLVRIVASLISTYVAYRAGSLLFVAAVKIKQVALNAYRLVLLATQIGLRNTIALMALFRQTLLTSGLGGFALLLGGVVAYFTVFRKRVREASQDLKEMNKITSDLKKTQGEQMAEGKALIQMLRSGNLSYEEREGIINRLNGQYGTTLRNLHDEKEFVAQLDEAYNGLVQAIERKIRAQAAEEKLRYVIERQIQYQEELENTRRKLQEAQEQDRKIYANPGTGEQAEIALINAGKQAKRYQRQIEEIQTQMKRLEGQRQRILEGFTRQDSYLGIDFESRRATLEKEIKEEGNAFRQQLLQQQAKLEAELQQMTLAGTMTPEIFERYRKGIESIQRSAESLIPKQGSTKQSGKDMAKDFYDAVALGVIEGETKVRQLTEEEQTKLTDSRKKAHALRLQQERELQVVIVEAMKEGIEKERAAELLRHTEKVKEYRRDVRDRELRDKLIEVENSRHIAAMRGIDEDYQRAVEDLRESVNDLTADSDEGKEILRLEKQYTAMLKKAEDYHEQGLIDEKEFLEMKMILNRDLEDKIFEIRSDAHKRQSQEIQSEKMGILQGWYELNRQRLENEGATAAELLELDIQYMRKRAEILKLDPEKTMEYDLLMAQIEGMQKKLHGLKVQPISIWKLMGLDPEKDAQAIQLMRQSINQVLEMTRQAVDAQVESSRQIVSDLDQRIDEQQRSLEIEIQRNEQGLASNIDTETRKLAELKKLRSKALDDQRKAMREQQIIDGAIQASSLITAGAQVFAAEANKGILGVAFAISAIATIYAMFRKFKAEAASLTKYEKGVVMMKGKRHSEGGIKIPNFGEVEDGEMIGVFNRKASHKHSHVITEFVETINQGKDPREFIRKMGSRKGGRSKEMYRHLIQGIVEERAEKHFILRIAREEEISRRLTDRQHKTLVTLEERLRNLESQVTQRSTKSRQNEVEQISRKREIREHLVEDRHGETQEIHRTKAHQDREQRRVIRRQDEEHLRRIREVLEMRKIAHETYEKRSLSLERHDAAQTVDKSGEMRIVFRQPKYIVHGGKVSRSFIINPETGVHYSESREKMPVFLPLKERNIVGMKREILREITTTREQVSQGQFHGRVSLDESREVVKIRRRLDQMDRPKNSITRVRYA